jgi:hypothetical protein
MILIFMMILAPSIMGAVYLSNKKPQSKIVLRRRNHFVITADFETTFLD